MGHFLVTYLLLIGSFFRSTKEGQSFVGCLMLNETKLNSLQKKQDKIVK